MVSRKAQSNRGTVEDSSHFSLGKQRSGGSSNKLPTKPNFLLAVSAADYIHLRQFPLGCLRRSRKAQERGFSRPLTAP
jgi:hypothetical protein